ncbi:MAG: hypothetical protein AOA65_0586 [Candidatus Bathyarchaeota archaeon BA1]|nr:MAG: hypothetical protein AOA65_0586 [Candidatus Bathyarchaeota archaeon BA1]
MEKVVFIILKANRNIEVDEVKALLPQEGLKRHGLQLEKVAILPK